MAQLCSYKQLLSLVFEILSRPECNLIQIHFVFLILAFFPSIQKLLINVNIQISSNSGLYDWLMITYFHSYCQSFICLPVIACHFVIVFRLAWRVQTCTVRIGLPSWGLAWIWTDWSDLLVERWVQNPKRGLATTIQASWQEQSHRLGSSLWLKVPRLSLHKYFQLNH